MLGQPSDLLVRDESMLAPGDSVTRHFRALLSTVFVGETRKLRVFDQWSDDAAFRTHSTDSRNERILVSALRVTMKEELSRKTAPSIFASLKLPDDIGGNEV